MTPDKVIKLQDGEVEIYIQNDRIEFRGYIKPQEYGFLIQLIQFIKGI